VPAAASTEFQMPGIVFSAARLPTIDRVPLGATKAA
jgi:hypothetical protein